MNCEICEIHTGPFRTEKEYIYFKKKIKVLIDNGLIKALNKKNDSPFFTYEYQCLKCRRIWNLLVPDQAFRGGWNVKI